MFNPLGAGVRWGVHLGGIGLGDTVLVLGAGQRGLAAVIAARAAGAGTIIVTGLEADAHKLALAREFGADHTLVVDGEHAEDTVERVREITGGELADVALELTPMAGGPITDALLATRHGGRVVLAGLKGEREIPLRTDLIINRAPDGGRRVRCGRPCLRGGDRHHRVAPVPAGEAAHAHLRAGRHRPARSRPSPARCRARPVCTSPSTPTSEPRLLSIDPEVRHARRRTRPPAAP